MMNKFMAGQEERDHRHAEDDERHALADARILETNEAVLSMI